MKNNIDKILNSFIVSLRDSPEYSFSEDCVKRAARFITLNRTCFNGLYRVNGKGEFNVPIGSYDKPTICDGDNLRKASLSLRQSVAKISVGDYKDSLHGARKGDFIYLDPPYSPTSKTASFTGYTNSGFKAKDQEELAVINEKLLVRMYLHSKVPSLKMMQFSGHYHRTCCIALRKLHSL